MDQPRGAPTNANLSGLLGQQAPTCCLAGSTCLQQPQPENIHISGLVHLIQLIAAHRLYGKELAGGLQKLGLSLPQQGSCEEWQVSHLWSIGWTSACNSSIV